jgi:hypothetical protein
VSPVLLLVELDLVTIAQLVEVLGIEQRVAIEETFSSGAGNVDPSPLRPEHVTQVLDHTLGHRGDRVAGLAA